MSIQKRIFLGYLLLIGGGIYYMLATITKDVRPTLKKTVEESLVDFAYILASLAISPEEPYQLSISHFQKAFAELKQTKLNARIYNLQKTVIRSRIYITDQNGIVLFDSQFPESVGQDYSRWNDVYLTLQGKYGARTTQDSGDQNVSTVLYVAAPIRIQNRIAGVLTVGKPVKEIQLFIDEIRQNLVTLGIIVLICSLILGWFLTRWITNPIFKLTKYVNQVKQGQRVQLPSLGKSEIGQLGTALDDMRHKLEGKHYVEKYIQNLTHEIKSPLSAVRGAAELLSEEAMKPENRQRFLKNILNESERIQYIIDQMLNLSSLENRRELDNLRHLHLNVLVEEVIQSLQPMIEQKKIHTCCLFDRHCKIWGEPFFIRQALTNLIQNAIDFSSEGKKITISLKNKSEHCLFTIEDQGTGIPDYALPKIFDRFYSLNRPETGKKSSGLGLSFVREVAYLHQGSILLENLPEGGTKASLKLPMRHVLT